MFKLGNIIMIAVLTLFWVILTETWDPVFVGAGLVTSAAAFFYAKKYLPLEKIDGIDYRRLVFYPAFLFWQIYLGAFQMIKIIWVGERLDIVTAKTRLTNPTLIAILGDSITLIPGTIMIHIAGQDITSVWLRPKTDSAIADLANPGEALMGYIEQRLIQAEEN